MCNYMIINNIEIGDRLKKIRLSLNFSQIKLSELLEIHQTAISEIEKGKTNPSFNIIKALSLKIDSLNIDWLLTGRGEMFITKQVPKNSNLIEKKSYLNTVKLSNIETNVAAEPQEEYRSEPTGNLLQVNDDLLQLNTVKFPKKATNNILVPVVAFGGYLCEWTQEYIDHDLVYLDVPGQPRDARTFEVSGTSMEPVIMSGDYVVCSRVERLEYIKTGFIYVIISVLEGITVKYVHDSKNMLILEPANRLDHAPTTIHKEDVKEIWQVVQRITKEITQPVQELFKPVKSPQNTNTSSV